MEVVVLLAWNLSHRGNVRAIGHILCVCVLCGVVVLMVFVCMLFFSVYAHEGSNCSTLPDLGQTSCCWSCTLLIAQTLMMCWVHCTNGSPMYQLCYGVRTRNLIIWHHFSIFSFLYRQTCWWHCHPYFMKVPEGQKTFIKEVKLMVISECVDHHVSTVTATV